MEKLNYSLSGLQSASGEIDEQYADFIDCCRAASCLRAAFQSEEKLDYVVSSLQILRDGISVFNEMESLGPAFDVMQDFRRNQNLPMDLLADYRQTEERNLDAKLTAVAQEAAQLYQRHVVAPHREFARLMRAQKLAFGEQGELATLLRLVMQKDHKKLAQERENFVSHWYGGKEPEGAPSLTVVDALIQDCWDKAGESLLKQKENDSLQGSRRNNMRSPIKSMVAQIGKWYKITDRSGALNTSDPAARTEYAKQKPILRQKLEAVQAECDKLLALGECGDQKKMGYFLIRFTACSLLERLDGSWTEEKSRFFFADFLRGDWIQLDEDFMPVLEPTFCVLKDFNVLTRIRSTFMRQAAKSTTSARPTLSCSIWKRPGSRCRNCRPMRRPAGSVQRPPPGATCSISGSSMRCGCPVDAWRTPTPSWPSWKTPSATGIWKQSAPTTTASSTA